MSTGGCSDEGVAAAADQRAADDKRVRRCILPSGALWAIKAQTEPFRMRMLEGHMTTGCNLSQTTEQVLKWTARHGQVIRLSRSSAGDRHYRDPLVA